MLHNAQRATGLECRERGGERCIEAIHAHPAVDVAESNHEVSGARGGDGGLCRWRQLCHSDSAVQIIVCGELLQESAQRVAEIAIGRDIHAEMCRVELPVLGHQWRQYLGIPATTGRQLDHGHAFLEAKKLQCLARVTGAVPRLVLCGTLLAVQGALPIESSMSRSQGHSQ